jgi:hypothetical protein
MYPVISFPETKIYTNLQKRKCIHVWKSLLETLSTTLTLWIHSEDTFKLYTTGHNWLTDWLIYQETEQSPWESYVSHWTSQKILHILCNLNVHYRVHNSPTLVPVLSLSSPVSHPISLRSISVHVNFSRTEFPGIYLRKNLCAAGKIKPDCRQYTCRTI